MMAKLHLVVVALFAGFVSIRGAGLEGGQLRAAQEPDPFWDEPSHQWVMRLTCGSFTFQGIPPLNVTWTTPMGEARFSSGYANGRFYLNLDAPLQGGNYSCAIPAHHLPEICDEEDKNPCENKSAEVNVDELRARLKLAEANQQTLEEMLSQAERKFSQDFSMLRTLCEDIEVTVDEHQEALEEIQDVLNQESQESKEEPDDDLSGPCRAGEYTELHDDWRSVDALLEDEWEGNHCDSNLPHGWYRFFLHGESAAMPEYCVEDYHCETHAPYWLDLQGQSFPKVGEEVDGRACANWYGDCCNWESPITVRNCGKFYIYYLQPRDTCHLAHCAEPHH